MGSRENVKLGEGGSQKQETKQASENRQKSGGNLTGAGSRLQGKAKLRWVVERSPGQSRALGGGLGKTRGLHFRQVFSCLLRNVKW